MTIHYVVGDATSLNNNDKKLLVHICNNIGRWGMGFVTALSKKWPQPEKEYKKMKSYVLGHVQFVNVDNNIVVGNMIAQNGINNRFSPKICRVDYDALRSCLTTVNTYALTNSINSIHMPKIGTGLAMGDWNTIVKIIEETVDIKIDVYVYTLE